MNMNEDTLIPLTTVISLANMIREMNRKGIELKRITKTAALLLDGGYSPNSVPNVILDRCLRKQHPDGGWVGIVDTMWNAFFLSRMNDKTFAPVIRKALDFILSQKNEDGLWGRSQRDISRIPVTGILFYLFPQLADTDSLRLLEKLWISEKNSITYKAGYTLMAFHRGGYEPEDKTLVPGTINWLIDNQEDDGGFSPWKTHPVESDVFCTSIALLGLLQYEETVPEDIFQKGFMWLRQKRLKTGIWRYHEIEDGASWGLYAWTKLLARKTGMPGAK